MAVWLDVTDVSSNSCWMSRREELGEEGAAFGHYGVLRLGMRTPLLPWAEESRAGTKPVPKHLWREHRTKTSTGHILPLQFCCWVWFLQPLVQKVSGGWAGDEDDSACQKYGLLLSLLLGCIDDTTQMVRRWSTGCQCLAISAPCLGDIYRGLSSEILLYVWSMTDAINQKHMGRDLEFGTEAGTGKGLSNQTHLSGQPGLADGSPIPPKHQSVHTNPLFYLLSFRSTRHEIAAQACCFSPSFLTHRIYKIYIIYS